MQLGILAPSLHRRWGMLAKTYSATHLGIDGRVIEIEAARQRALPSIQITGLPGEVVKESRERVRASLSNLGFDIPSARIVVHLSPAHARKQGSQFDLAIAVSVLLAEGCLPGVNGEGLALLGEISLDGRVQRISGALPLVHALEKQDQVRTILLPRENGWEAALIAATKVRLVENLAEAIDFLRGKRELPTFSPPQSVREGPRGPSLDGVIGQALAKRALQISLAGRHHLLLVGPPGVGKSMLAACAPALLPPLTSDELIEVVKSHGHLSMGPTCDRNRPFRSPHHSISGAGFLGGGSGAVIPGEVTLAHNGVLFLDEFPEFRRDALEGLREPLQNGEIHLHRVGAELTLPARFTLIAAMNPCPCGYALEPGSRCFCAPEKARAYRKRLSGPILDRLDLCVVLGAPRGEAQEASGPSHVEVEAGIARATERQETRFGGRNRNGDQVTVLTDESFVADGEVKAWLEKQKEKGRISFRGLAKLVKVARTIADIEGREEMELADLQEAWALRSPEALARGS